MTIYAKVAGKWVDLAPKAATLPPGATGTVPSYPTVAALPASGPAAGDPKQAFIVADHNVYEWKNGKWNLLGITGLGGWADITAVTGSPSKHPYKDADGMDWVAYQWTADGSITVTKGLVDRLLVSGGGGEAHGAFGNGGYVVQGVTLITAATHLIKVGAAGTNGDWDIANGAISSLGPDATGRVGAGSCQAPNVVVPPGNVFDDAAYFGMETRITGTPLLVSGRTLGTGKPGWVLPAFGAGYVPGGAPAQSGVVIIRVPAEHAKA
jgi:hypothetical protein